MAECPTLFSYDYAPRASQWLSYAKIFIPQEQETGKSAVRINSIIITHSYDKIKLLSDNQNDYAKITWKEAAEPLLDSTSKNIAGVNYEDFLHTNLEFSSFSTPVTELKDTKEFVFDFTPVSNDPAPPMPDAIRPTGCVTPVPIKAASQESYALEAGRQPEGHFKTVESPELQAVQTLSSAPELIVMPSPVSLLTLSSILPFSLLMERYKDIKIEGSKMFVNPVQNTAASIIHDFDQDFTNLKIVQEDPLLFVDRAISNHPVMSNYPDPWNKDALNQVKSILQDDIFSRTSIITNEKENEIFNLLTNTVFQNNSNIIIDEASNNDGKAQDNEAVFIDKTVEELNESLTYPQANVPSNESEGAGVSILSENIATEQVESLLDIQPLLSQGGKDKIASDTPLSANKVIEKLGKTLTPAQIRPPYSNNEDDDITISDYTLPDDNSDKKQDKPTNLQQNHTYHDGDDDMDGGRTAVNKHFVLKFHNIVDVDKDTQTSQAQQVPVSSNSETPLTPEASAAPPPANEIDTNSESNPPEEDDPAPGILEGDEVAPPIEDDLEEALTPMPSFHLHEQGLISETITVVDGSFEAQQAKMRTEALKKIEDIIKHIDAKKRDFTSSITTIKMGLVRNSASENENSKRAKEEALEVVAVAKAEINTVNSIIQSSQTLLPVTLDALVRQSQTIFQGLQNHLEDAEYKLVIGRLNRELSELDTNLQLNTEYLSNTVIRANTLQTEMQKKQEEVDKLNLEKKANLKAIKLLKKIASETNNMDVSIQKKNKLEEQLKAEQAKKNTNFNRLNSALEKSITAEENREQAKEIRSKSKNVSKVNHKLNLIQDQLLKALEIEKIIFSLNNKVLSFGDKEELINNTEALGTLFHGILEQISSLNLESTFQNLDELETTLADVQAHIRRLDSEISGFNQQVVTLEGEADDLESEAYNLIEDAEQYQTAWKLKLMHNKLTSYLEQALKENKIIIKPITFKQATEGILSALLEKLAGSKAEEEKEIFKKLFDFIEVTVATLDIPGWNLEGLTHETYTIDQMREIASALLRDIDEPENLPETPPDPATEESTTLEQKLNALFKNLPKEDEEELQEALKEIFSLLKGIAEELGVGFDFKNFIPGALVTSQVQYLANSVLADMDIIARQTNSAENNINELLAKINGEVISHSLAINGIRITNPEIETASIEQRIEVVRAVDTQIQSLTESLLINNTHLRDTNECREQTAQEIRESEARYSATLERREEVVQEGRYRETQQQEIAPAQAVSEDEEGYNELNIMQASFCLPPPMPILRDLLQGNIDYEVYHQLPLPEPEPSYFSQVIYGIGMSLIMFTSQHTHTDY